MIWQQFPVNHTVGHSKNKQHTEATEQTHYKKWEAADEGGEMRRWRQASEAKENQANSLQTKHYTRSRLLPERNSTPSLL